MTLIAKFKILPSRFSFKIIVLLFITVIQLDMVRTTVTQV